MASKNVLLLMILGLMCLVEGDDHPTEAMPCVKKLIPCQPYLHMPEKAPVSCCLPLKQMVSNDTKCLCGLFNNADMLKKLNLTQAEALKLPKACGANADISICNKDVRSPPKSPATPSPPSVLNKSAANSQSDFEASAFTVLALVISATAAAF